MKPSDAVCILELPSPFEDETVITHICMLFVSFLQTLAEVKKSENNILICGSFFIMKDVRKALGHPHDKPDQCDDEEINEV